MIKMLHDRCTGIYNFGNNTYPRRIRRRSNLGHIFREKKCVLWAGKYGTLHLQLDCDNWTFLPKFIAEQHRVQRVGQGNDTANNIIV